MTPCGDWAFLAYNYPWWLSRNCLRSDWNSGLIMQRERDWTLYDGAGVCFDWALKNPNILASHSTPSLLGINLVSQAYLLLCIYSNGLFWVPCCLHCQWNSSVLSHLSVLCPAAVPASGALGIGQRNPSFLYAATFITSYPFFFGPLILFNS